MRSKRSPRRSTYCAATVVIHPDDRALYNSALALLSARRRGGLRAAGASAAIAASKACAPASRRKATSPRTSCSIHDAARVFPSAALIARAVAAGERCGAAAPGAALSDTVKQVNAAGRVVAAPDRAALRAVQTPQAFR